jgi:hypothetical protein
MVLPPDMTNGVRWLAHRLNRGELMGYRVGRTWRMTRGDVEDLIERHRNRPLSRVGMQARRVDFLTYFETAGDDLNYWVRMRSKRSSTRAAMSSRTSRMRPLSLPWRHIQSLRDADQPVQKVPSRVGYPRRSARIVQRSVGDERPSSTAHLASPSMDSLYYPSLSFALSTRVAQRASPRVRLMGSASLHRP